MRRRECRNALGPADRQHRLRAGIINTALRSSNNWGSIATIPNVISPPRFGCRQTMANFNDDHVYNRGCSFVIKAGSRTILMHESGAYNVTTELSFSYMT